MSESRSTGAISTMRLPELKELASTLGIEVDSKARKADLIAAIRAEQSQPARARKDSTETTRNEDATQFERSARSARTSRTPRTTDDIVLPDGEASENNRRNDRRAYRDQENSNSAKREPRLSEEKRAALEAIGDAAESQANDEEDSPNRRNRNRNRRDRNRNRDGRDKRQNENRQNENRQNDNRQNDRNNDNEQSADVDEEVLIPVAGIFDTAGNQSYLRTGGYLPGTNDAAVSPQIVKQYGLRRGDAIVGAVRQRGENEGRNNNNRGRNQHRKFTHQKLNQLVQIDSINSLTPEESAARPEFGKLTPLYPQETLRLETSPKAMTPRAIDLVSPIGKGQRGLIVSPPKAGKTMVMQQIAMAVAQNYPAVHLMVVLVDERPEEVTDMKRLVKGEVIASTFDRPASDHTIVAELAIERAKRLVELGQDVVVLLDSLTRLSRAYNLAAPASGRILSGGVDAAALYPPKKFFGAARNIEEGGSLTIIASALVETGSKMDEVIFEEFKGTGNMELRLSRQLADRRIFPAIDVNASGTRREELLFNQEELKVIWQVRRALGTLDVPEASDFLLGRLRKTESNAEFLVSIMRSMQGQS